MYLKVPKHSPIITRYRANTRVTVLTGSPIRSLRRLLTVKRHAAPAPQSGQRLPGFSLRKLDLLISNHPPYQLFISFFQ
jgi:hypothetical protein